MKQLLILCIILIFSTESLADSPITSTTFWEAYKDYDVVVKANNQGIIDPVIADYLLDPQNPVDVKAAVLNALSWRFEGKNNSEILSKYILARHKEKSIYDIVNQLNADELMCLGYLKVLDDYFKPAQAIPFLQLAKEKNPKSYTVNILLALTQSQDYMDNDWCKLWQVVDKVRSDQSLKPDLKQEAIDIIFEYIDIYSGYCGKK